MSSLYSTFIDSRNQHIWDFLIETYNVSIEHTDDKVFAVRTKNTTAVIYVPVGSTCKDSFTHELLHAYLHKRHVLVGNYITLRVMDDPLLSAVISDQLLEHLANCAGHVKMLLYYLQMGYDRKKFLSDFEISKCSQEDIDTIRICLSSKKNQIEGVNLFLGKLFAMKACPNESFDYSGWYHQLGKIDNELYTIGNEFWTSWEEFDIEKMDLFYDYYSFADTFIENLKGWIVANIKFEDTIS